MQRAVISKVRFGASRGLQRSAHRSSLGEVVAGGSSIKAQLCCADSARHPEDGEPSGRRRRVRWRARAGDGGLLPVVPGRSPTPICHGRRRLGDRRDPLGGRPDPHSLARRGLGWVTRSTTQDVVSETTHDVLGRPLVQTAGRGADAGRSSSATLRALGKCCESWTAARCRSIRRTSARIPSP